MRRWMNLLAYYSVHPHVAELRNQGMEKTMTSTQRALLATTFLIAALPALSACNTIAGAGQDVESAGEGVQEMSKDVQDDL